MLNIANTFSFSAIILTFLYKQMKSAMGMLEILLTGVHTCKSLYFSNFSLIKEAVNEVYKVIWILSPIGLMFWCTCDF